LAKEAVINNIVDEEGDVQLPCDPLQDKLDAVDILSDYIQSGAFADMELDSNIDPRLQIPSLNQRRILTPLEEEVRAHNAKVAANMILRNDGLQPETFLPDDIVTLKIPRASRSAVDNRSKTRVVAQSCDLAQFLDGSIANPYNFYLPYAKSDQTQWIVNIDLQALLKPLKKVNSNRFVLPLYTGRCHHKLLLIGFKADNPATMPMFTSKHAHLARKEL
jgi:hypothetical protein